MVNTPCNENCNLYFRLKIEKLEQKVQVTFVKLYDVIIVGSGVAGLSTALHLNKDLNVLLLCKREMTLCNSSLAQGGMVAVYDTEHDSCEEHIKDTMIAGRYENNLEAVTILSKESKMVADELLDLGVDFDRTSDGKIDLTLEGGHSKHRILHYKDSTGKEIVDKLIIAVKRRKNVTVMEYAQMCNLKKVPGGFSLDILQHEQHHFVSAPYCVLATGGIGRIYQYTTNSAIATGDGIAMAYQLGAKIQHLSYIQFHPTAFYNAQQRECFLISEAVRGNGAYLRNCHMERFMHKYDERLELAPRDVVSQAIMQEQEATGSKHFYLDISHKDPEFIKTRFPMIYHNLLQSEYDLTREPVPIYPCQHYLMGGIQVDLNSESTIPGLFAVGECSHTGVHGRNRLASNSLLEGIVFGRRSALHINQLSKQTQDKIQPYPFQPDVYTADIPKGTRTEIRSIMQKAHFVLPNRKLAEEGFIRINDIKFMLEHGQFKVTPDYIEAKSLATCAYIILKEIM